MHVIQVAARSWLVLDEITRPRWLISEGPLVHKATGETHVMHRVMSWNIDPAERRTRSVHDGLNAAQDWCREELARPDFRAPIVGAHRGTAITVEEQRRRWEAGLDPWTGKPRVANGDAQT